MAPAPMKRPNPLVLALLVVLIAYSYAAAQTVEQVERTWRDWMNKHDKSGGLAVLHAGRPVREAAIGQQIGEAVPLASLSKAVTGVCVATLIERGRLTFESPLSQALARTLVRVGQPEDPRLAKATVSELLVHRAGLLGKPDVANASLGQYLARHTARRTAFDAQLKWILDKPLAAPPGARFAYSNAGYLILGAIIEEASGRDYEGYCRDTVLLPLGARDAGLDPAWRILSSYGGWRMPLADYGRFYQAFAVGNPAIGPRARAWMMSPEGKQTGGGVHYGRLGTFVRPTGEGEANFWHWGAWTYSLPAAADGPLSASYATFAVRLGDIDVNMVVHIQPNFRGDGPRGELDRSLGQAARAVKVWP
jgi:CubicO group peptidase (beta-lactamase class C family)